MRNVVFILLLLNITCLAQNSIDQNDIEKMRHFSFGKQFIPFYPELKDTTEYCCPLYWVKDYTNPILASAKNLIISRAGLHFFNRLELESVEVYFSPDIDINYENQSFYKFENYEVRYYISYNYKNKRYPYGFGLLLNSKGELISDNKFPDISKNNVFENVISSEKALKIAKETTELEGKLTKTAMPIYIEKLNSFCWLIEEEYLPKKLGVYKDIMVEILINANSGKIEAILQKEISGIACGYETIKKQ